MKRLLAIYLTALSLLPFGAQAAEFDYPNRYSSMAESLFDMIDAFANAFQNKKREYSRYPDYPHYSYAQPYGYPGQAPYLSPYAPQFTPRHPLNGQWRNSSGEVLIIRHGRFRIYQNRHTFREGHIQLHNEQFLSITDSISGLSQPYQYALHNGRLALQDEWGNLILYIRAGG